MEMKELAYFIAIAEEREYFKGGGAAVYGSVQPQPVFKYTGK